METLDLKSLQNGSDVRGVALGSGAGGRVNLTPETAARIASAYLIWLSDKTGKAPYSLKIAMGRDPRLSGKALLDAAAKQLQDFGTTVLDCGLASTPAMFMSTVMDDIRADGAVMFTASHLPYDRNGLKFFTKDGSLGKTDIAEILEEAGTAERISRLHGAQKQKIETPRLMDRYTAHLRSLIRAGIEPGGRDRKPLAGLKIAVDAGNGAGGFFAKDVLAPLGADVSPSRYLDPDGTFPNHIPNPENKEAMAAVCEAVKQSGADLGLIFDTDVDRSAAVDENGRGISRNGIVALAAVLASEDHPGSTVVTDSITSRELTAFLEETLGMKHYRYRRGYRNVIDKAIELNESGTDCELAIETSGHAAFRCNYFLDDGAYLAARIVIKAALLKREGKGLSSVIADLKEPAESVEFRLPIQAEDPAAAGQKVLDDLSALFTEPQQVGTSDGSLTFTAVSPNYEGLRVDVTGDVQGWFLLRLSLHEPLLPLNIEAEQEGGAKKIALVLLSVLRKEEGIDISPITQAVK